MKFFFAKTNSYYWEEPFLYKYCADQIIRRCVPEEEQLGILSTAMRMLVEAILLPRKVLQSGFHWSSLFKVIRATVG